MREQALPSIRNDLKENAYANTVPKLTQSRVLKYKITCVIKCKMIPLALPLKLLIFIFPHSVQSSFSLACTVILSKLDGIIIIFKMQLLERIAPATEKLKSKGIDFSLWYKPENYHTDLWNTQDLFILICSFAVASRCHMLFPLLLYIFFSDLAIVFFFCIIIYCTHLNSPAPCPVTW